MFFFIIFEQLNKNNNAMNLLHYFDLKGEMESFDSIHAEIEKGIVFKGTNLWILMCAILVASVGLNAPINDLSRGCNADEVYKMSLITACQS